MGKQRNYDYYRACRNSKIEATPPQSAILLIGGAEGDASGEDAATQWFLERAKGGRYLVLRVGGVGSQADWMCERYGDWLYSAAELSVDSREAANDPDVIDYIREADALFIAGGDQNQYQELWEGTATEDAINYLINEKQVPVAGTSAGVAILGDYYYAPDHQGVLSSEILNDPFHYNTGIPEQLEPVWPLIWHNDGKAVKVYRIAGTPDGSGSFDLKDWSTALGGKWEYWYTTGGVSGLRKSVDLAEQNA